MRADFVRIGQRWVNLALVHEVEEWGNGSITIRYTGDNTELGGDEARLFLAYLDGNDEVVDELYPAVNPVPESHAIAHSISEYCADGEHSACRSRPCMCACHIPFEGDEEGDEPHYDQDGEDLYPVIQPASFV